MASAPSSFFRSSEAISAGWDNWAELKKGGYTLTNIKECGIVLNKGVKDAGWSCSQVREAGFSSADATQAGWTSLKDLKQAGYSCGEAKQAGFSFAAALAAGYTKREMSVDNDGVAPWHYQEARRL